MDDKTKFSKNNYQKVKFSKIFTVYPYIAELIDIGTFQTFFYYQDYYIVGKEIWMILIYEKLLAFECRGLYIDILFSFQTVTFLRNYLFLFLDFDEEKNSNPLYV